MKFDRPFYCFCIILINLFFPFPSVCGGRLSAGPVPALLYSHAKYGDQNYGSRAECNWIVTAGTGSGRVRIRFESFDLEPEQDCAYDFVQITDGFESSRSLGKFCGNKVSISVHFMRLLHSLPKQSSSWVIVTMVTRHLLFFSHLISDQLEAPPLFRLYYVYSIIYILLYYIIVMIKSGPGARVF